MQTESQKKKKKKRKKETAVRNTAVSEDHSSSTVRYNQGKLQKLL